MVLSIHRKEIDEIVPLRFGAFTLCFNNLVLMFNRLKAKAITSFIIFILVFLKDILVGWYHLIPARSRLNREITWFFILPISLIGVVLTIIVMRSAYLRKRSEGKRFFDINVLFALPLLLYISLFVVMAIIAILYEIFI